MEDILIFIAIIMAAQLGFGAFYFKEISNQLFEIRELLKHENKNV